MKALKRKLDTITSLQNQSNGSISKKQASDLHDIVHSTGTRSNVNDIRSGRVKGLIHHFTKDSSNPDATESRSKQTIEIKPETKNKILAKAKEIIKEKKAKPKVSTHDGYNNLGQALKTKTSTPGITKRLNTTA